VENVIDDAGEKGAVVADQENRFVRISEVLLQPPRRLQVEVIGWFVEKQNIRGTYQLPCQSESSTLSTAQLLDRLSASLFGIKAKTLKHCVHSRSEGISAFPVKTLEIPIVSRQQLWGRGFSDFSQHSPLFRQRALEREQIGKFSSTGFPYGLSTAEIAMLFQESEPKAWLASDRPFRWLL
jgi:hypothetical protein